MKMYIKSPFSSNSRSFRALLLVLVLLAAAGCYKRPTTPIATTTPTSEDHTGNADKSAATAFNPDTDIADVENIVPDSLDADVKMAEFGLENW